MIDKLNCLPYREVEELQKKLGLSLIEVLQIFNISRRTLSRRKKHGWLTEAESEKLRLVFSLVDYAEYVLESKASLCLWFKSPQLALGNKIPLDYLDSDERIGALRDLLGRIEHGVFL